MSRHIWMVAWISNQAGCALVLSSLPDGESRRASVGTLSIFKFICSQAIDAENLRCAYVAVVCLIVCHSLTLPAIPPSAFDTNADAF